MVSGLDYDDIKFPVSKKDYSKIEQKIAFELMYSRLKMVWSIQSMYQIKSLKIYGFTVDNR